MLFRSLIACALSALLAAPGAYAQMKAPKGPVEITVGSEPGRHARRDHAQHREDHDRGEDRHHPDRGAEPARRLAFANAYNYVLGKKGDESVLLTLASPVFTTPIMQGTPSVIDQIVPIAGFIQSELVFMVAAGLAVPLVQGLRRGGEEGSEKDAHRRRAVGRHRPPRDRADREGGAACGSPTFRSTAAPRRSPRSSGGNVEATFATLEEGLPVVQGQESAPARDPVGEAPAGSGLQGRSNRQGARLRHRVRPVLGVAAPPGTDPAIAAWWEDKFRKAVATKAWQDGLKEKFQRSDFYGLAKAGDYFKREEAKFRSLMDGRSDSPKSRHAGVIDAKERRLAGIAHARAVGGDRVRHAQPELLV